MPDRSPRQRGVGRSRRGGRAAEKEGRGGAARGENCVQTLEEKDCRRAGALGGGHGAGKWDVGWRRQR